MAKTKIPAPSKNRPKKRFRELPEDLSNNTAAPYTCYLPEKTGWFSSLAFRFLFRNISTGDELKTAMDPMDADGIVVYATKYQSNLEYLFSHYRFSRIGIPAPQVGLGYQIRFFQPFGRLLKIFGAHTLHFLRNFSGLNPYKTGFYRDMLTGGKAGFLSLSSEGSFQRRFVKSETDPIRYLIDLQKETDRPVYIVPQLLFFGINPHRETPTLMDVFFGSEERPGKLRRLYTLMRKNKKVFLEFSNPVCLKDRLASPDMQALDPDTQAAHIRLELLDLFNRHRQSITGPVLKDRNELIETMLTSDKIQTIIEEHVTETGKSRKAIRKKASGYLDEIAANYSMSWIKIYDLVLTWMLKHIFDGISIDQEGLARLKERAKEGPLLLVPCHKSHLDYLILSYIFHHNNMPCPHIAAGKNLSFWPLGTIFRGGGAFFLRRTFKGQKLYAQMFSAYVEKLLVEGFNLEFFIEGGRSRTGKLLAPKMGLLSQVLTAYGNGATEDIIIAPIYIGYDRVLEEKSYLHELGGGEKEPESVGQIVKARKSLKVRYGKVYVNFDEPISLKEFLGTRHIEKDAIDKATHRAVCDELGHRSIHGINKVSVVTPYGIVAGALLNIFQPSISYERLTEVMDAYLSFLASTDARLSDTLQVNPAYALRQVADTFVQRGFIEKAQTEDPEELRMVVVENKRAIIDYYKNNSISFFIPAAYTALAILEQDALQFAASDLHVIYNQLSDFFADEFFQDPDRDAETIVRKCLKAFIDDAILVPHPTLPDTYNVTAAGLRKLKHFAAFLLTYFESYWVALNFFMRYPSDAVDPKNRIKKVQAMGNRMNKRGEINRSEALSGINYKNAVAYFTRSGIQGTEDKEKIGAYADMIQRYINLILT